MLKEEKKAKVQDIKQAFNSGRAIFFTNHSGIKAESTYKIRDKLGAMDAIFKIVKNTLALLAAGEVFQDLDLDDILKGPTSLIISGENMVSTAKLAREFSREFESFKIKGGIIEGKLFSAESIEKLAGLPSREVLIGQFMGMLVNPVTRLVTALSGVSRNLVVVLDSIRKQKEQAA